MRTMSVTELRSDWGRVSREVEFGAVVRITRRGRPIARLSSATEANDEEAGEGGRSVPAPSDSGSKRRTGEK
jgi:prevent-host-death family protein